MITIAMKNVQFTICAQTFDFSSKVSVVFFVSNEVYCPKSFEFVFTRKFFVSKIHIPTHTTYFEI